jgi:hypothetical protein
MQTVGAGLCGRNDVDWFVSHFNLLVIRSDATDLCRTK